MGDSGERAAARAVVYCRVSTHDQADHGYSLPSQAEACRRYAAANGLEVIAELCEDCSGATPIAEREVGAELAALVASRRVRAVVVHQVDRLSRDIVDLLATVQEWKRAGIEVHAAADGGRFESELDIQLVVKAWKGSTERLDIRERSMRGKRAKAKAGHVVGGRAAYGYHHTRDTNHRIDNYDIVESEAEVIRMIYRLYLEGDGEGGEPLSASGVAKHLSELRIPTPGETRGARRTRAPGMWQPRTVLDMLSRELYAGVYRYGDELIEVDVPVIVDRATWGAAQRRRDRNRRMSKRNRKRDYLLSSLIRCSCGRSMVGSYCGNHRYYRCSEYYNTHRGVEERQCLARPVRAGAIEADVWDSFTGVFADLERLAGYLRAAQERELEAVEPSQSELATVEAMIEACQSEARDVVRTMMQTPGIVRQAQQEKAADIDRRYEVLVERRRKLADSLSENRITDEAIADTILFAEDVRLGIEVAAYRDRRRLLEDLDVVATVDAQACEDGRGFQVTSLAGQWEGMIRRLPRANAKVVIASVSSLP